MEGKSVMLALQKINETALTKIGVAFHVVPKAKTLEDFKNEKVHNIPWEFSDANEARSEVRFIDQSWESVFNQIFVDLENRCFRDRVQVRRFKRFVKMKIWSLKNLTYWESEDCVQTIMQIMTEGVDAFYRLQYEEFFKRKWRFNQTSCFDFFKRPQDPEKSDDGKRHKVHVVFKGYKLSHLRELYKIHKTTGVSFEDVCRIFKTPIRTTRAQFSTWMFRHLENKYNSQMTKFFCPKRAFESARLKTETIETVSPGVTKKVIGTTILSRSVVDDPESPVSLMIDDRWENQPELMRQVSKFCDSHKDVIKLLIDLPSDDLDLKGEGRSHAQQIISVVRPIAENFNLGVKDFICAIRGLFGHDSSLQTT
jgi:hypothetical protein